MMGLFCSYFQEVQHLFFQILPFILKQHKELPPGQVCRDMYMIYNTIYDISILFFYLLTHNCSSVHLSLSTHCQGIPNSLSVSVTLIMKRCLRKPLMILCFLSQPSSFQTIFSFLRIFPPFPLTRQHTFCFCFSFVYPESVQCLSNSARKPRQLFLCCAVC